MPTTLSCPLTDSCFPVGDPFSPVFPRLSPAPSVLSVRCRGVWVQGCSRWYLLAFELRAFVYFAYIVVCMYKLFYISCLFIIFLCTFYPHLIFYSYYFLSILVSSWAQARSAWFQAFLLLRPWHGCRVATLSLRTYTGRVLNMGFRTGIQGHTIIYLV